MSINGVQLEVVRSVRITNFSCSAQQWELFTFDDEVLPTSELAATALNRVLVNTVNSGATRIQTTHAMNAVRVIYRNTGALDSECTWMLEDILDEIFGSDG